MISVIVPTYNYGRYLNNCLDSVVAQTLSDWECILVDNASTDNTELVVSAYVKNDDRIKYCKLDDNKGPSCARNVGIKLSKGEYVLFLDADDIICSRKMENALILFDKHPDSSIVYSDMRYFEDGNNDVYFFRMSMDAANDSPWMSYQQGGKQEMLPSLLQGNQMVISSPIIKKSALDEVGFFDETLLHYEDWEFWLRFAFLDKRFLFDSSELSLTLIRVHKSSHSSNNALKMWVGSALIGVKFQNEIDNFHLRTRFRLKTLGSFFLIDQMLYRNRNNVDVLKHSLEFLISFFPRKQYVFFLKLIGDGKASSLIQSLKYYYRFQYIKFILTKKLCQLFLYVSRPISK